MNITQKIGANLRRVPGGTWVLGWTDPLHLARRLLHDAVKQRAHHAHGRLLDVGCGGGPYRELFSNVSAYVGLDITPHSNVDVAGDAQKLPFIDNSFDTVLCNEVLEHVAEPSRLMSEVARVLRPGGVLLLTTPQTWGLHHEPHDYYRFTHYGLRYQSEQAGLQVISVTPTCGLWATSSQRIVDTIVHNYASGWPKAATRLLSVLLGPVLLVGAALDKLSGARGDTLDNVLVARKP